MQQRHQHILTRLPKEWKIIFVQPSLIGAIFQRKSFASGHSMNKNIHLTSMPIIHKADRNYIFRHLNDIIIIVWSKFLLWRYHIKHPIVLFYEPRFSPVMGRLDESLIWYEFIDDRLGFSEVPKWIKNNIETILAKADFVTASSVKLHEMATSERGKESEVFLVSNGVDFDHFITTSHIDDEIVTEMRNLNRTVIGYIGSIGEWFDFELIQKIAKKFPTIVILIIGFVFPKQLKQAQLLERQFPNVRFLGRREYSTLPSYLTTFSASIIPFKIYSLTQSVNPTKFYEYCAIGKPVITTPLPELEKYQDKIHYARNHEEFLESLASIIVAENNKQNESQLRCIAKENSWDRKVEIIMSILSKFIGNWQGYE